MIKPSLKTITIKRLLSVGLIILTLMLLLIAFNFYSLINTAMQDKGRTLALSVESALTSHMLSGTYEDKEKIIKQAGKLPGIINLKIYPNEKSLKQFHSLKQNKLDESDDIISEVFNSRKENYVLPVIYDNDPLLRVSFPYIASAHKETNCLNCHQVDEGEVLAVLDFSVKMKNYLGISITYLFILSCLFIITIIGMALLLMRVLNVNVIVPLRWLVEETKSSFHDNIEIDITNFETLELDYVAQKLNQFNKVVLQQNNDLLSLNSEIEATQKEIIHEMGCIGETRSKETANHVIRVAEITYLLACELKLPEQECNWLRNASPMHDIGKVGTPDVILHKPGKLNHEEFVIMQQHCVWGYMIFNNSQRPLLKAASIIAYQHHERWDGEGYPQRLKGEDIHIYGRITAVADVFDALASKRCYKEAWPIDKVRNYFIEKSGSQFDPQVVNVLLANFEQVVAIVGKFQD